MGVLLHETVRSIDNILMTLTDTMFNKLINIVKNHSSEELFTKGVSEKEIPQSLISDITSFFVKPLNSMLLSKNSETIDIGDILAINDNRLMKITKDSLAKLRFLIVQKLLGEKSQWIVSEVYTQHNSADFEQVIVAIGNSYFGIMDKNNLYTENNQINITFDNNTAVQLKHIKPELIEKNNLQKTSYRPLIVDALKNTENATEILNFFNNKEIKNILRDDLEFLSHSAEIISNKAEKNYVLKENLVELICNEIIAANKNILVSYSNYNVFMQTTLLEPILNKLLDKQIDITDILAQLEISQIASLSQQNSLKNLCDRALTLIDNADESKKKIADNFVKIHRELMKYGNSHIIPLIINTKLINSALGIITERHDNELLICARHKNAESVKVILQENSKRSMQNKLDINQQNYDSDNALTISTKNQDVATLTEILKENNININLKDEDEFTALMIAVKNNNAEIVKMLLEKNANTSLRTSYLYTALMIAVESNYIEIAKILLEKNADVNLQGGIYYYTALMTAVHYNRLTCVEMLLNHRKTDINLLSINNKTALMVAIDNSNYSDSDMYMYEDSYPDYYNKNNDNTTCVEILLNHQADVNIENEYGETALILATKNGKVACVEMMLNHQADINLQNKYGSTALMFAAENGKEACVEMLLNHQADINLQNKDGSTALMYAAKNGKIGCVEMLLNHQAADINIQDNTGYTALMYAIENSHTECIKILLEKNADVNLQENKNSYTALMVAVHNNKASDIDHSDSDSDTDYVDSDKNAATCVAMLLNHQATDINIQDSTGYTALMYAAENGCTECIKMLLEHKVDINLKNNNGETALDIAKKQKHTECTTYLESHSYKRIYKEYEQDLAQPKIKKIRL